MGAWRAVRNPAVPEPGRRYAPRSVPDPRTRADLTADLRPLGLAAGDAVLAHGALRRVGPLIDGPDTVVGALLDAVSPGGTVLAYADWQAPYTDLLDDDGLLPERWRAHVPPFDPVSSHAIRDNGALPEFLRLWPGALRSGSPGASVAALGRARRGSRPTTRSTTATAPARHWPSSSSRAGRSR